MKPKSSDFVGASHKALADEGLQGEMRQLASFYVENRRRARAGLPEFDDVSAEGAAIRDRSLDQCDQLLERFETAALANGSQVHWCATADSATRCIIDICRSANARAIAKGKSMVSEEIGVTKALEAEGMEVVETDVGEYIIQLADEPPSHIIGPAMHKTRRQVAELFLEHHRKYGKTKLLEDAADLVAEAREVIRPQYFQADVGITGANFLVAETGSAVIVTNECNGDLVMALPDIHIVVTSIEKVVATLSDTCTLVRLLTRSATGQEITTYVTYVSGPRNDDEIDGPREVHFVLYDGGRSEVLGSHARPVLRCIRCGSCLNHCPVYKAAGGHAYGWVYPGPIGAALNPGLIGPKESFHLPRATSACGRCDEVCPVQIPLTEIMHGWRAAAHDQQLEPRWERIAFRWWGRMAVRPRVYRWATRLAAKYLRRRARKGDAWVARLPGPGAAWSDTRDFPAPAPESFLNRARRLARTK